MPNIADDTPGSADNHCRFIPCYERLSAKYTLGFPEKVFFSLFIGTVYAVLFLVTVESKDNSFYENKIWVLAVLISVAMLALYIATDTFRQLIPRMEEIYIKDFNLDRAVKTWLSDPWFVVFGILFGLANLTLGSWFGIEGEYNDAPNSHFMLLFGFFIAGFICGMAAGGIVGLLIIFAQYTPHLNQLADYHDPDGCGGSKHLGNALLVFGLVTTVVGVLISIYIAGFTWDNKEDKWVRLFMHAWIIFPYVMAFVVVAIPAVTISYQLSEYKQRTRESLLEKINPLREVLDQKVHGDREQKQKQLSDLEEELAKLYKMSIYPFGNQTFLNAAIALLPNLFGTWSALSDLV